MVRLEEEEMERRGPEKPVERKGKVVLPTKVTVLPGLSLSRLRVTPAGTRRLERTRCWQELLRLATWRRSKPEEPAKMQGGVVWFPYGGGGEMEAAAITLPKKKTGAKDVMSFMFVVIGSWKSDDNHVNVKT